MRKIHIDNLVEGTKLAKAIFTSDGKILLAPGIELKKNYIEKLKSHNISEIYIEDEISTNIQIEDIVCEQTRQEAKILTKDLMDKYLITDSLEINEIKEVIDKIIDELLSEKDILIDLSGIRTVDDYTFEHSLNVCILSLVIGIDLGHSRSRLRELGVGALLHDIGKLKIPEQILKKPSQLTVEEFEEIKKHTLYGYEILKNNKSISMVSTFIALGHHERYDGSGYPFQLKGNNIHLYARIVAVADVYDALTSDRVYRNKLCPHEVFEYITSLGYQHFDQQVINSFVKHIAIYPTGTGVILNTRERGIVVRNNKSMPKKPVVRILCNDKNEFLNEFYEVDLAHSNNLFITDTFEISLLNLRKNR